MKKNLTALPLRTISGAVYIAIIITVLYIGQWLDNRGLGLFVCRVAFLLLATIGIHEVYHNLDIKGIRTNQPWGYALGILCFTMAEGSTMILPVAAFGILAMVQLFRQEEHPFETIGYTMLPILWVVLPLSLIPHLVAMKGPDYPMLIFILIWINDTFAYLCGITFGKHKMSPRHSPNKTWEGTLGGALFCIAAAVLLGNLINFSDVSIRWESFIWLPLGVIVALFGTMGDLVESMFKRYVGVKDSGKLMPGHGGLLDRFDSLIMVLPFATLYASLINL